MISIVGGVRCLRLRCELRPEVSLRFVQATASMPPAIVAVSTVNHATSIPMTASLSKPRPQLHTTPVVTEAYVVDTLSAYRFSDYNYILYTINNIYIYISYIIIIMNCILLNILYITFSRLYIYILY